MLLLFVENGKYSELFFSLYSPLSFVHSHVNRLRSFCILFIRHAGFYYADTLFVSFVFFYYFVSYAVRYMFRLIVRIIIHFLLMKTGGGCECVCALAFVDWLCLCVLLFYNSLLSFLGFFLLYFDSVFCGFVLYIISIFLKKSLYINSRKCFRQKIACFETIATCTFSIRNETDNIFFYRGSVQQQNKKYTEIFVYLSVYVSYCC